MLFHFRNSNFLPYYFQVYRNMQAFERMVDVAARGETLEERMRLADETVQRAKFMATGYYASPELEQIYIEAASTLPEVECYPIKGTILHVMTTAYTSGGHTRVVQRWIDMSKSDEQHSVVLLNQGDCDIPQWLCDAVQNHHGELIIYDEPDRMKRALQLRELAANFERIILHVHMDDPTALIAFGTESFTTPIIYFNHADHLFWLGVSIADMVVDMRYDHISYSRRNVSQSYTLGIPCEPLGLEPNVDKFSIRRELGIADNDFVIITTGNEYKYQAWGGNGLWRQFVEITKREKNVSCYAIGPDPASRQWKWAYDASNGKVYPLGVITDKDTYRKYLQASDLYIGSYPYGGYTSMMDAVQCGLPFLQLLMTRQQKSILCLRSDIDQSRCLCYSTKDLVERSIKIMKDKSEYQAVLDASMLWANDYVDKDNWKKRLYEMYSQCPQKHSIHTFECRRGKQVYVDDELCLMGLMNLPSELEPSTKIGRYLFHRWLRIRGI